MRDPEGKFSKEPSFADFLPKAVEGFSVAAGSPRAEGSPAPDRERIVAALQKVHDPEIPVNIYDLGLVYAIEIKRGIHITMTLTSPNCPVAGEIPRAVAHSVAAVENAGEVFVTLTWEPPWSRDRMSEDARLALDMLEG